jgi:hypothetical protein
MQSGSTCAYVCIEITRKKRFVVVSANPNPYPRHSHTSTDKQSGRRSMRHDQRISLTSLCIVEDVDTRRTWRDLNKPAEYDTFVDLMALFMIGRLLHVPHRGTTDYFTTIAHSRRVKPMQNARSHYLYQTKEKRLLQTSSIVVQGGSNAASRR